MVKSQFKTFGFWAMSVATLFGPILFFSGFLDSRTPEQSTVCFVLGPVFMFLFGSQLWRDAKILSIDTLSHTISFTNLFTRHHSKYSITNFDGFVDMYQPTHGGSCRVLYLVKGKKFVKKISGYYYSNLDELQNALAPLKYMGQQSFNLFKSIQILFGVPVYK